MIDEPLLRKQAGAVAKDVFGPRVNARRNFVEHLLQMSSLAEGKDFLLIHNPGGWGCARLDQCLEWERSVVEGIRNAVEHMGYSSLVTQYFRGGESLWSHIRDIREQVRIALGGPYSKAAALAAELKFITELHKDLRIVMVGISQGAGFSNAVMRQIGEGDRVYSVELGMPFIHAPRRLITSHVLTLDGNGEALDPVVHRDLWMSTRVYTTAPARWVKYKLTRKPKRFARCIDLPGHDYNWKYPHVRNTIEGFLLSTFGAKETSS